MIHHYRGQQLDAADLRVSGHALSLVRCEIARDLSDGIVDLCDPHELVELGIRPDETASPDRRTTQGIAARLHASGYRGLRWWSALRGDWHTLVLFRDRLEVSWSFDSPEPLSLSHPVVRDALRELGMKGGDPDSR
jgi:hypothetical protein